MKSVRRFVVGACLFLLAAPTTSLAAAPGQAGQSAPRCTLTSRAAGPLLVVCAPGFATSRDEIRIFPRTADAPTPGDRVNLADLTTDAVWSFEPAAGDTALLIDFHPGADGALVADLYDDINGDGKVSYELRDGVAVATEGRGRPTMTVTAPGGWWQRNGRTNFDLDLSIDGSVRASFNSYNFLGLLKHDGKADFVVHVRDRAGLGRPDLEWKQFYPPLPEGTYESGHYRTEIMVNDEHDEVPISGNLIWPYLAAAPRLSAAGEYVKPYNESPAPIEVDWKAKRIVQLDEFVASRGNPGSYFIYSITRVLEGTTSVTNFENPFAFYDLAGAEDGYPDMSIRLEVTLPVEVPQLRIDRPIVIAEYSWDQHHDHNWTYALNVVGQPLLDGQTIQLPDFGVTAVPPTELPGWVSRQTWDSATFVEVTPPYWTTEHVYDYTVEQGTKVLLRYLAGLDSTPPATAFADIVKNFRGERAFDLDGPARLYISPIDGRLHLYGAEAGVWNMGAGGEIRYASLGGKVIDHWTSRFDGRVKADLYTFSGQAFYVSRGGVLVGDLDVDTADAELLTPPTNNADWTVLGKLTAQAAKGFAPDDLRAMFRHATGDSDWIPGAKAADFRATADGFQFLLTLGDASTTARWAADKRAGDYVVTFSQENGYRLAPVVPANLLVSPVVVVGDGAQSGEAAEVSFSVKNDGDVDAPAVQAELQAWRPGDEPVRVGTATVNVEGRESVDATVEWRPPDGGEWLVRAYLPNHDIAGPTSSIDVGNKLPTQGPPLSGSQDLPRPVFEWSYLILLALTLGAAVVGVRVVMPALSRGSGTPALVPVQPAAPRWGAGYVRSLPTTATFADTLAIAVAAGLLIAAEIAFRVYGPILGGFTYLAAALAPLSWAVLRRAAPTNVLASLGLIASLRLGVVITPQLIDSPLPALSVAVFAGALAVMAAVRGLGLLRRDVGLVLNARALVLAVLLVPSAVAVASLLASVGGGQLVPADATAGRPLFAAAALLAAGAVIEQLAFRGVLQSAITDRAGAAVGILTTAALLTLISTPVWQPQPVAVGLGVSLVVGWSMAYSRSVVPALLAQACLVVVALVLPL